MPHTQGPVGSHIFFLRTTKNTYAHYPQSVNLCSGCLKTRGITDPPRERGDRLSLAISAQALGTTSRMRAVAPANSLYPALQGEPRCLIIVPAYNEGDSIATLISRLKRSLPEMDVLVVDDGSTDLTARQAAKRSRTLVLPFNLGIGGAMQTGFRYADMHGYDIAIQVDGDGQHRPREVRKLVETLLESRADLVVGSRFMAPGSYHQSRSRAVGSALLRVMLRLLTPPRHQRLYQRLPRRQPKGHQGFRPLVPRGLSRTRSDPAIAPGRLSSQRSAREHAATAQRQQQHLHARRRFLRHEGFTVPVSGPGPQAMGQWQSSKTAHDIQPAQIPDPPRVRRHHAAAGHLSPAQLSAQGALRPDALYHRGRPSWCWRSGRMRWATLPSCSASSTPLSASCA